MTTEQFFRTLLYQAARVETHAAFLALKRQAGFYAP